MMLREYQRSNMSNLNIKSMKELYSRIKYARKKKKLSQASLSHILNVSQPTIANWESGSHIPQRIAIENLAKALDVCPTWLVFGETDSQPFSSNSFKFLQSPVRNIPVYIWPINKTNKEFNLQYSAPTDFIPIAIDSSTCFAMQYPKNDMQPFLTKDSYIIFDQNFSKLNPKSFYLIDSSNKIILYQWKEESNGLDIYRDQDYQIQNLECSKPKIIAEAKIILKHI